MHKSIGSASEIKSSHTTCYRFDLQKKAANDTTIECSTAVSGKPVQSFHPPDITTFVTLSLSHHSITLSLQMSLLLQRHWPRAVQFQPAFHREAANSSYACKSPVFNANSSTTSRSLWVSEEHRNLIHRPVFRVQRELLIMSSSSSLTPRLRTNQWHLDIMRPPSTSQRHRIR